MSKTDARLLHLLYANEHLVVATPNFDAFAYCRTALGLEARFKVTEHTQELTRYLRLPASVRHGPPSMGEAVFVDIFVSTPNVIENMRKLIKFYDLKPGRPW